MKAGYDLPGSLHVIVRDWLNANHVVGIGCEDNAVVDSGHVSRAAETVAKLKAFLARRPLHRLINTHCHSDHMGGNATLQRVFGCRTVIPEGEADLIRRWDTAGLWLDYAGQRAEPFTFDAVLRPGDYFELGDLDWLALAAPGHDMGALMFWCAHERLLISGDALWEGGFGIVLPGDGWQARLEAARDTLKVIRGLRPRLVIPGHGQPFAGFGAAIEACLSRIAAFQADERKLARYVLKVMLVYTLMERDGLLREDVVATFADIPMFRDYAAAYMQCPPDDLVAQLLRELAAAGRVLESETYVRAA